MTEQSNEVDPPGGQETALTAERLGRLLTSRCGLEVGDLTPETRLEEIELSGPSLLLVVSEIEEAYDIEFPADLLQALETVNDLLYYTHTKASQNHEST